MISKKKAVELGLTAAGVLVEKAPGIFEGMTKKKEEKNFFEENKTWIFLIILAIFINNFAYINLFNTVILNSVINILYGSVVLTLLILFYCEDNIFLNIKSKFIKFLIIAITALGVINSAYHIGYAIINLITLFR